MPPSAQLAQVDQNVRSMGDLNSCQMSRLQRPLNKILITIGIMCIIFVLFILQAIANTTSIVPERLGIWSGLPSLIAVLLAQFSLFTSFQILIITSLLINLVLIYLSLFASAISLLHVLSDHQVVIYSVIGGVCLILAILQALLAVLLFFELRNGIASGYHLLNRKKKPQTVTSSALHKPKAGYSNTSRITPKRIKKNNPAEVKSSIEQVGLLVEEDDEE
ncbi:unnamed protein product [Protopolystoma xenopodis]|uniref:Uncharacterized protein n=1 Tax=Protopolystoma xenopodis TaxID=117903 RepID=A0A448XQP6_9PLAT|nr:unnamed protein product [Protopolystoma xenopodis]